MKQRSCLLVKPDGVQKKVVGKVLDRFEREGLDLVALKMIPPNRALIENFYSIHKGKLFYGPFIEFMMEGPAVAMVWEGENAVARVREIIGATDSKEAAPGTLRNQYGTDNRRNLVHASDSPGSAEREIALIFKPGEIVSLASV